MSGPDELGSILAAFIAGLSRATLKHEEMACAAFLVKYDVSPVICKEEAFRDAEGRGFVYRSYFRRPSEKEQRFDRAYIESRIGAAEVELLAQRYANATDLDPLDVCVFVSCFDERGEATVSYQRKSFVG